MTTAQNAGQQQFAASYSPLDYGAAFAGCIIGDCALVPLRDSDQQTFIGGSGYQAPSQAQMTFEVCQAHLNLPADCDVTGAGAIPTMFVLNAVVRYGEG